MHTDAHRLPEIPDAGLNELTKTIIGCAFRVQNELGCGFLEKVYENALAHELRLASMEFVQQSPILIRYQGVVVGDYVADLVVANRVLVELKACSGFDRIHYAQCLNYLKATGKDCCLLLNFGTTSLQIKRFLPQTDRILSA